MATINHGILLALDPSSTRTGWAVLDGDGRIQEAGHITPDDSKADAGERIESMVADLRELLDEVRPGTIIVEWPSGHPGARHKGKGAGLAVYGCAVGALWIVCRIWADEVERATGHRPQVERVREDVWTRRQRKRARAAVLAAVAPEYNLTDDQGMDCADAVEMGLWWIEEARAGAAICAAIRHEEGVS